MVQIDIISSPLWTRHLTPPSHVEVLPPPRWDATPGRSSGANPPAPWGVDVDWQVQKLGNSRKFMDKWWKKLGKSRKFMDKWWKKLGKSRKFMDKWWKKLGKSRKFMEKWWKKLGKSRKFMEKWWKKLGNSRINGGMVELSTIFSPKIVILTIKNGNFTWKWWLPRRVNIQRDVKIYHLENDQCWVTCMSMLIYRRV